MTGGLKYSDNTQNNNPFNHPKESSPKPARETSKSTMVLEHYTTKKGKNIFMCLGDVDNDRGSKFNTNGYSQEEII